VLFTYIRNILSVHESVDDSVMHSRKNYLEGCIP
jgi:hypothetical protein